MVREYILCRVSTQIDVDERRKPKACLLRGELGVNHMEEQERFNLTIMGSSEVD